MSFKQLYFTALAVLFSTMAFSQTGVISGKVYDAETGEGLIAVNVYLTDNVTTGAVTDLDGNYSLSLPEGSYNITASYIGYENYNLTGVVVKAGQITEAMFPMGSSSLNLDEVTVEARKVDNTAMAILAQRKAALTVNDGISSQELSRTNASNAGDAVKQITGASIEGGKYMVVRGLGDRYSITQLNGVTLPSTDPYRNSASLDLIPSFMLDNIVTSKTFSPDMPGSFSGGNMNIKTKSFPEKFFVNFGTSVSYNTVSHLKDNFLVREGGLNELPEELKNTELRESIGDWFQANRDFKNGDPTSAENVDQYATELNSSFLPNTITSPIDYGVNFSIGDKLKIKDKNPFGYVFGLKYKKSYSFYDQGTNNRWNATGNKTLQRNYEFNPAYGGDSKGEIGDNLGAFVNLTYQLAKNHEISVSSLYNNDVNSTARVQEGIRDEVGTSNLYQARSVGLQNRSVINGQLRGNHYFPGAHDLKMEWVAGITSSNQTEPDLRLFSNHTSFYFAPDANEEDKKAYIDISGYGFPSHFFRELHDKQYDAKVDFELPITVKKGNKLKFGGLYSSKQRDFFEYRFKVRQGSAATPWDANNPDWDAFFSNDNFGIDYTDPNSPKARNYYINDSKERNIYSGEENIAAGYGMIVYQLFADLKVITGARVEMTDISVYGVDTGSINKVDVLPSLNLIYALSNKMNLRASASQTIARPNMREMAPFFTLEFLGGFLYSGNSGLDRTLIQNYDLRWEFYPRAGESVSLSAYYKKFTNPIVKVFVIESANGEVTYDNLPEAHVLGGEFEFRKKLDKVSSKLKNFEIAANLSYIYSQVDIRESELNAAREIDPEYKSTRPFQGQSPYLANANLFYVNDSLNLQASFTFNVFGPRLYEIGTVGNPDVYEQPRPLLNFNIQKSLKEKVNVSFSIGNILGARYKTSQTFRDIEYVVDQYDLGRTFSLGISYRI